MRVFDFYCYNIIGKVKFNKTKAYIDNMLSELGLEYHNTGFLLHCGKVDELFRKFPALQKYCRIEDKNRDPLEYGNRIITSLSESWHEGNIYADPEELPAIYEIFSKIPRPYNFGFSKLILDGIDWYGEGQKPAALETNRVWKQGVPPLPDAIGSCGILMKREFDDGTKRNTLWVKIEATSEGEPRDTHDIVNRLEPYLGLPEYHHRRCFFAPEEYERNIVLSEKYPEEAERLFADMVKESPKGYPETIQSEPMILNLCTRQMIKRVFKKNGIEPSFDRTGLPGLNVLRFTDGHNFMYEIMLDRSPSVNVVSFRMNISGCGFSIGVTDKSFFLRSKEEAEAKVEEIARFVVRVKESIGERLAEDFGDCPSWFR